MIIVVLAACSLSDTKRAYTKAQLLECLEIPLLTYQQFEDNQLTTKRLLDLYVFTEQAKKQTDIMYGKVDLLAELELIDANSANYVNKPAYHYFSELIGLFYKLQDAHTTFIYPSAFYNFFEWLPFRLMYRKDGKWYLTQLPDNYAYIYNSAVEQGLVQNLGAFFGKEVTYINNVDPLQYMTMMSSKYTHRAKSEHANVNWYAWQDHFVAVSTLSNFVNDEDAVLHLKIGEEQLDIPHIYQTMTAIASDAEMQDLYRKSFTQTAKQITPVTRRKLLERYLEHGDAYQARNSADYTVVYSAGEFFQLFKHGEDYILAVYTFSIDDFNEALEQIVELHQALAKIDFTKANLFISLSGNTGGYVYLSHMLSFVFSHNEFPIHQRNRMRRTEALDKLLKANITLAYEQWADWLTGATMSPDSLYFNSSYLNQSELVYFDGESLDGIPDVSQRIYSMEPLILQPNHMFIVADGTCGSACATFLKKLKSLNLAQLIALGGSENTIAPFEAGSFAGGMVLDSAWVGKQIGNVSDVYLNSLKYKHDGALSFTHAAAYNYLSNTPESALQTPLEFVVYAPDYIIKNVHLDYFSTTPEAIDMWIDQAVAFAVSEQNTGFGEVCDAVENVEYRSHGGKCQKFSCSFGYMRSDADFTCVARVDYWKDIKYTENGSNIWWIILAVILICAALVVLIVLVVLYFRKKRSDNSRVEFVPVGNDYAYQEQLE